MVPIQSSLTVTLPMSKGSHQDHNPFPGELPYIIKFNEKVCVDMANYYHCCCTLGGGLGIFTEAQEDQYFS